MVDKKLKKSGRPEGGTIAENVKINARKRIAIKTDFAMPKINVKEVDATVQKYRCCMCGSSYTTQSGNAQYESAKKLFGDGCVFLPKIMTEGQFMTARSIHAAGNSCSYG